MLLCQKSALFAALGLLALCLVAADEVDEKDVLVLTPENFDEVIQKNDNVLVEFYAPWCGHCKRLVPEYAAAATQIKAKNINAVLAKVDADQHKELGGRYQVQGFPTLKWFVKGTPTEYKGGRTGPEIVSWISKRTSDPVTTLKSADEVAAFTKENEYCIIAYLAPETPEVESYKRVAASDDEISYGVVTDEDVATSQGYTRPSVVAYRPEIPPHQSRTVKYVGAVSDENELPKFAAAASLGLVTEFTPQSAQKIFGHSIKTQILLFTDSTEAGTAEMKNNFLAAAAQSVGKAVFVTVDAANKQVVDYFGVEPAEMPRVFIVYAKEGAGLTKYRMADAPTTDAVVAFLDAYHAGTVQPHLKSEREPLDNSAPVKVLVGKTFDLYVNDESKDVLVEFYAPWCGHCKELAPIYDKMAKELLSVPSLTIAKMDATANDPPPSINIEGFPTIMLFKANDKAHPVPFTGARTAKAMKEFLAATASIPFELPKKKKKTH